MNKTGVQDFSKFVRRFGADVSKIKLKKGSVIAVDSYSDAYRIVNAMKVAEHRIVDVVFAHLVEIATTFLKGGYRTIFVFDNPASRVLSCKCPECGDICEHEMDSKEFVRAEDVLCPDCECECVPIFDMSTKRTKRKNQKVIHVSRQMMRKISRKLEKIGFPVVYAESEGERGCAWLVKKGKADAVLSKDTDVATFGYTQINLYKHERKSPKDPLKLHFYGYQPHLLKEVGLSKPVLRVAGILLGNDLNPRDRGNGPATVEKIIREMEEIDDAYRETEAWRFFALKSERVQIVRLTFDLDLLKDYLSREEPACEKRLHSILTLLTPVEKKPKGATQEYFNGSMWVWVRPGMDTEGLIVRDADE